ncbi:Holliday junction resolvase RuvX [Canibacter zhoujuaniae]|uniref:Holliday junction resolvase RuvX n=1 Tax=Canibacter zhoujuaniae TaxID=2708343 RepID=UPI001423B6F3|nr:Holliday junction resolvase RuvX [Canibacter zhoujuaniae]
MLGARLGIDVGRARIGVARCDALRMLAVPVETVARIYDADTHPDIAAAQTELSDLERIRTLAEEYSAVDIVVGLPLNLQGERTPSTDDAEKFASALQQHLKNLGAEIPVRLVDERLSTVTAQAHLHQSGKNVKNSRKVIDQAAAVVILQQALDSDRFAGKPVGTVVN